MFKLLSILFISILFTGCFSITKELPAYKTYNLNPDISQEKQAFFDKSIMILEPRTLESLNSKAISYKKDGFISDSYVLSRWSDKPTKLIQQSIASYLNSKNRFKYITTSKIKLASDYTLHSELFEFNQSIENKQSFAKLSIRVYLINNKNKKVEYKNFNYKKETKTIDAIGFVEAQNSLVSTFLKDLNIFISSSLENGF
ncbi:ABC-type transport auxiliary lipoprotein family protein [Arcobacter arenosus]|jgi:cholesterol transport system auxiliary component|uniref:ABC-type transport auxiliary lipoprotein family protein n=1 Tax=Arcobacter arenosus TaxID=2576037 RepID=UPI003BAC7E7B